MKLFFVLAALILTESLSASSDYTSLRVFPGFSSTLIHPQQVEKMTLQCQFENQNSLVGVLNADPNDSQKLKAAFEYRKADKSFVLSTAEQSLKTIDVALGEQVIERNGLGRGPNPSLILWGDHGQSLSLEFFFWFGDFQMTTQKNVISMTTKTAPFKYIDGTTYDQDPGRCSWQIYLK